MNTIDAMKQAVEALSYYQVGMNDFDCHKAVENDKSAIIALNKAIKREKALAANTYDTRKFSNLSNQANGFTLGGCPSCGKQDCVARSCTREEAQTVEPLVRHTPPPSGELGTFEERAALRAWQVSSGEQDATEGLRTWAGITEREAMAQELQVAAPQGWKLVPNEPTDAMKVAAWKYQGTPGEWEHRMWVDMLAASPQPPQAERVPMTPGEIDGILRTVYAAGNHGRNLEHAFARAVEAHHKIGVK